MSKIYSAIACLALLCIVIRATKTSWFKGVVGELKVNLLLRLCLPKKQYYLMKNVTLPTPHGTTQIDHIVVSPFGLFVLETKNMQGCIVGDVKKKQWEQHIFNHVSQFQNPLHQNYRHLKALQHCLTIPLEYMYSLVVFTGRSTFKAELPAHVTHSFGAIRYIKSQSRVWFSQEEVCALVDTIERHRFTPGVRTNRKHKSYVKKVMATKAQSQNLPEARLLSIHCPQCGAKMICRIAMRGGNKGKRFWGCSAFPRCKATVNMSD